MSEKAQRVPIKESSCIEWARYAPKAKKLLVKFNKSETKYVYNDVELETLKAWVKHSAEGGSVGQFFILNIKAAHTFSKVEAVKAEDPWAGIEIVAS